jgi:hypothetical protein
MVMNMNNDIDDVYVFDDLLPSEMRQVCYTLLSRPKWSFDGGGSHSRFWHMNNLEEDWFFKESLYKYVKMCLFEIVVTDVGDDGDVKVKRIYANGQTATQSGVLHRDDDKPNAWTFMYYSTPDWKPIFAGNTQFFSDDKNLIKTVQYVSNRAVIFPSRLWHMAEAPARQYGGLRTTVAYKMDITYHK